MSRVCSFCVRREVSWQRDKELVHWSEGKDALARAHDEAGNGDARDGRARRRDSYHQLERLEAIRHTHGAQRLPASCPDSNCALAGVRTRPPTTNHLAAASAGTTATRRPNLLLLLVVESRRLAVLLHERLVDQRVA